MGGGGGETPYSEGMSSEHCVSIFIKT